MILIVSNSPAARGCAATISKLTGQKTTFASDAKQLSDNLRETEFNVVVIDQVYADLNPRSTDAVRKHGHGAVVIFPNFALWSADRVASEVQLALQRRERDRAAALQVASQVLRGELNDTVTGILLHSELALADPDLPKNLKSKLQSLHRLAMDIKTRLSPTA